MHPKLKGFPGCWVVNLEESRDRREYMIGEFEKLGITNYRICSYPRLEDSNLKITGTPECQILPFGATSSHLLTIKKWYEETDEEMVAIFEDDCLFNQIDQWPFVWEDYVKKHGVLWDALQLCVMHEGWAVMAPRHRVGWDHGLQCYIIKRGYAKKIVDYYFVEDNHIRFRMPLLLRLDKDKTVRMKPTIENIIYGLGVTHIHPLFNHNVERFPTTVHDHSDAKLARVAQVSFEYVRNWWNLKGEHATLDQLFDYDWCCPKDTGQTFGNLFKIEE